MDIKIKIRELINKEIEIHHQFGEIHGILVPHLDGFSVCVADANCIFSLKDIQTIENKQVFLKDKNEPHTRSISDGIPT